MLAVEIPKMKVAALTSSMNSHFTANLEDKIE